MQLTSASAASHGSVVLAYPALYDASGCMPPLGDCRYAVLATAPTPSPRTFLVRFSLRLGAAVGFFGAIGVVILDARRGRLSKLR